MIYVLDLILLLIWKLHNYLTIQKPYKRSFPELSMASFVDALRPEKFSGMHFKRWSVKVTDWLTAMKVFWIKDGMHNGNISGEDQRKFQEANDIFVGAVRNVLSDYLFDSMMHLRDAKALCDHLNATYGASDAGKELYTMESFNNYKMVANKLVVEQAHEIQRLAKELELLKYILPDEFLAGCIIAKLPSL
jgi:hypothetical protein